MQVVGRVESVWRYPVKSMMGEKLDVASIDFGGVRGDRVYAIGDSKGPLDFPYFTARQRPEMLLCRPTCQAGSDTELEIQTPGGEKFGIGDPRLLEWLTAGLPDRFELKILRSQRALTDCSPVSLLSVQTVEQLGIELGQAVDPRRFRASVYLDFQNGHGFTEDQLVGHKLRIGTDVLLVAMERDVRCKMITLDPENGNPCPELMKLIARSHETCVGIYADVLGEGVIRPGDPVEVVD